MANETRAIQLLKLARSTLTETPADFQLSINLCKKFLNLVQSKQGRLSNELRTMICRKCSLIQVPGLSCTIRHKSKRNKHLTVRCLYCGTVKRFRTDKPEFSRRIFSSKHTANKPTSKPNNVGPSTNAVKPHIVLFKSETEPDEYRTALEAVGFAISRIPMQRMIFINENELESVLFGEATEEFRSIIVSSVNAVRAIERLGDSDSIGTKIHRLWSTRSCFTVGKKTRSSLERLGFRVQHTFADGADVSSKFSSVMAASSLTPVLYLTGDGTGSNKDTDFVAEQLEVRAMKHRLQNVFSVQANAQLREEYDRACLQFGRPDAIIFFSPQTTAFIVEQIALKESEVCSSAVLIAIGEPTAVVMRSLSLTPAAVVQPNVKNVLSSLADKYPSLNIQ